MNISVGEFGSALDDILSEYMESTTDALNALTDTTAETLRKRLSDTSPVGARKKMRRSFRKDVKIVGGISKICTVHSSEYRLLHLVENGHLTRDGITRTKAAGFIKKAVDEIIPEYEKAVEKAVGSND